MPANGRIKEAFTTRSVVRPSNRLSSRYVTLRIASVADALPAWGSAGRDPKLRSFMRSEDVISSAVFTMQAKYAGFPYTLQGGPRSVEATRNMLALSEHGRGWQALWSKVLTDAFSCDNAGWIELYRERHPGVPIEASPVVQLNHLDSLRCHRTGKWDQPIEYEDANGKKHKMMWYDVIEVNDFPQPDEDYNGLGFCAMSRIARTAQIMRDIGIHTHEKVSGQFNKRVTIVNGVSQTALSETLEGQRVEAQNQGLLRYIQPALLTALDPRAPLNKLDIDLAALPEGWDEDVFMRWFIIKVAMAFGEDPQEFAPLQSGGALGSSQQSEILHLKGENKGPNLFTSTVEHQFNYLGVIPPNVSFKFGRKDSLIDIDTQRARLMRAQELAILVKAGIMPPEIAMASLAQEGAISPELVGLVEGMLTLGDTEAAPDLTRNLTTKKIVPAAAQPNKLGGGVSKETTDAIGGPPNV